MHPLRKRRLITLSMVVGGLAIAAGCILYALKQNINLYLTPSEITVAHHSLSAIRVGGMVQAHSVHHDSGSLMVHFSISDYKKNLNVEYGGVLPALFREGQGVVIDGHFEHDRFVATRVLAKHDENYMPPKIKKV